MKNIIALAFALLFITGKAHAYNEPATPSTIAAAIKNQSGCNTAGYVWVPASNTCVAQSGGGAPGGSNGQIQYNNGGTLGGLTPSAALSAIGAAPALPQFSYLWGFGDSYMSGLGATNSLTTSFFALLSNDVPVPYSNLGVGGTTAATITTSVLKSYAPSLTIPSLAVIQGGENDNGTCSGATAACGISFGNMYRAADVWLMLPDTYRIRASSATKSGTWTADTSNQYIPTVTNSPGNAVYTTTSGSTLTFSIPSSAATKVGLTYYVTTSGTGTFTVSVDGTNVTDDCSSSTTFTSAPCAAVPAVASFAMYRQEYSVTPNQAHTVVVTSTNAATVEIVAADWTIPSGMTGLNPLFHLGLNLLSNWVNAATWNAVTNPLVASLAADGLPDYFVDMVNGTPGVNATTDLSTTATATCPASTYGSNNHPNDCGYLHMYQTLLNTAKNAGYNFQTYGGGGKEVANTGILNVEPHGTAAGTIHSTVFASLGGTIPGGIDIYNLNNTAGYADYQDQSTGKPWSSQYVLGTYTTSSLFWNCTAAYGGNASTVNANSSFTTKACFDPSGNLYAPLAITLPTTITPSATPAISVASGLQTITLSANATPTIGTIISGTRLTLQICQPATGGPYTWTWPAAIHGGMTIGTTASTCSVQSFDSFNGTTLVAENAGTTGVAP